MKTMLMKKNVAALVLATVITVPVFAQGGITDGSIPCQDVAQNEEAYGCSEEQQNERNRKYKCLKALGSFQVPLKNESNDFNKPGVIKKSDDMVAAGKSDGSIVFGDSDKNFKITKQSIKEAIAAKYGALAQAKEKFLVTFQTLKGKITLAFDKKEGQDGSYDIGKWEKVQEGSESGEEALVSLGNQAHQAAETSNALGNMSQSLDDKVSSFESNVEQKLDEINDTYQDKKDQVDQNSQLAPMEKIAMKRSIDQEKETKKDVWRRMRARAERMRQLALSKCLGQPNLISESTLRQGGGSGGGGPANTRGIASAVNR